MAFTTTKLIGGGVLIEGTDIMGNGGSTILRSDLWNQVKEYNRRKEAEDVFNTTVVEFFKPLTDAAEALQSDIEADDVSVVVLEEGVPGSAHVHAKKITLDPEGVILRILEEGDHDLLRWVNNHIVAVA